MDVSIIIVNYKTTHLIKDCIKSILSKTIDISYEIIVVDNNSNDDFQQILTENFGNKVICLPLNENLGFGKANNAAIPLTKGRNILFLNPDTILINNAIKILSDFLDQNPDCGVCGANIYNINKQPAYSHSLLFPSIFYELDMVIKNNLSRMVYGKNIYFNFTQTPIDVKHITGADMMVKRSVLSQISGFSPDFFMYFEDTELNYRIYNLGYRIMNVPTAKIIHLEGKSFNFSERRERTYFTGRKIFFQKVHSTPYFKFANAFYKIYILSAITINWCFRKKENFHKYRNRLKIFNDINSTD